MRTLLILLSLLITPALAQEPDPYVDGDYQAHLLATRPDGGMTVVIGVPKRKIINLPPEATKEEYIEAVKQSSDACRDDATCTLMPDDWFPPFDRRLRNAWKKGPDATKPGNFKDVGEDVRGIDIDMPKAKVIWKNEIERASQIEAANLEADITKADLSGDNQAKAQAQQKRNALNGIINRNQAAIDAATTPEELMAIWPEELPNTTRPLPPKAEEVQALRAERAAKVKK